MSITALSSTPATSSPANSGSTIAAATAAKPSSGAVTSAVNLASQASIVAILGGSGGTSTYSAAGLLNSFAQAGQAPSVTVPSIGTDTSQVAQLANDAGVVNTLTGSASSAGAYSATGTLQNLSASVTASYADALASNPGLTSTFVGASFNAGIVATINTTA